jgi:hypothetical protein
LGRFGVLELLHQLLERAILHRLEAREGERRLVAEREEDDGVALGGAAQLVVEKPLVEDPDVCGRGRWWWAS